MSLVRLFSTALDVNTVNSHAEVFESCPNYWIPREALETNDVHTAVEREVCRLFHDMMQDILPTQWAGAEFWIQARHPRLQRAGSLPDALVCFSSQHAQVYEPGKGLAFHFDKDEQLFLEQRKVVHPLLSTVVYLAGDTSTARLGM